MKFLQQLELLLCNHKHNLYIVKVGLECCKKCFPSIQDPVDKVHIKQLHEDLKTQLQDINTFVQDVDRQKRLEQYIDNQPNDLYKGQRHMHMLQQSNQLQMLIVNTQDKLFELIDIAHQVMQKEDKLKQFNKAMQKYTQQLVTSI
ncbi:MAG: hypothetical protein K0U52_07140 [Gammaproteobacteria bacterium]|nr:hypothetical protein [Gammaproteobacteria bacterium]